MAEILDIWGTGPEEENKSPEIPETNLDLNHFTNLLETITPLLRTMDPADRERQRRNWAQDAIGPMEDGDLIAIINNSTRDKWVARPSYFSVIVDELRDRNLIPKLTSKE